MSDLDPHGFSRCAGQTDVLGLANADYVRLRYRPNRSVVRNVIESPLDNATHSTVNLS